MKHIPAALIALTLSAPAHAEEPTMDDLFKHFEDLSKNAQTLLEGWVTELGPKLEELGPALEGFANKIEDMSAYHPPEVLENGDIIIRKKQPLPPQPDEPPQSIPKGDGVIDL